MMFCLLRSVFALNCVALNPQLGWVVEAPLIKASPLQAVVFAVALGNLQKGLVQ